MSSLEFIIPAKDPSSKFREILLAWLGQVVPEGWSVSYCIIDDGSVEGYIKKLLFDIEADYRVVRNERPLGRSGAINVGVKQSKADYVVILDSDCRPISSSVLLPLIHAFQSGKDLVFGKLSSEGEDFWSKYFRTVAEKREQEFFAGNQAAFTTQYCAVKRDVFEAAGRFSEEYRHYGFEDRDLILRLSAICNTVAYVPESAVFHDDEPSLQAVCQKMFIAGKFTAPVFNSQHPEAYKRMQYSRVDYTNLSPLARGVADLVARSKVALLKIASSLLSNGIPFFIKKQIVKILSGVFFLAGTREGYHSEKLD